MAILNILHFPDPRLRNKAQVVKSFDDDLRKLAADMLETMYQAPGIGLASTQVNDPRRLVVIDISEERDDPLCLVNPEILEKHGEHKMDEGCLSVPGIYEPVIRATHIKVRAQNLDGETIEFEADELLAVCIQHELDHLEGKLFIDNLSALKRQRIRKKLEKEERQAQQESVSQAL
ncbi:peptide deformylase [Sedimenticola thiotaurini]|uniref:Peptide deformylase n=1 Tax=Sedimenticola thiotaurini TaxID=1543721 RepID=A0A0F7K079_9GAMM|nr:peptide deformylase [Sedimenticola thiotaurini]AKH21009.1 peptide deformylase [Sedimenticola thiotaurini]